MSATASAGIPRPYIKDSLPDREPAKVGDAELTNEEQQTMMAEAIAFESKTGSGKTVMTSALLDELKRDLEMKFMDCAYIWIAPNKLHIQSYMSFRHFRNRLFERWSSIYI